MTRPYTPSLGARETGKNAREFVRDNKDVLWRIAKPIVIGMGILLAVMGFVAGALGGLTAIINPFIGAIAVFVAILGAMYLGFKFCFYFPAKAVDNSITLKQSFNMTKGYFWKMMGAWFFGLWRISLLMIVVFITMSFIIGMLIQQDMNALMVNSLIFLMTAPILAYFYPLIYSISVTILSNYYQHSLQNKPVE